jgi:ATP-binding cassette subfamily F protein uup
VEINESAEVSGRKVIEVRNVTHGYGGRTLLRDFSLRVMRGDRLGIIGNNGVGKSTLLRILLGELAPDTGSVKLGTNLEAVYFDQLRRELDPDKTVAEIVGEGREYVTIHGQQKHVVSYLTDFLFPAKRAMTPISALSGGERNRVILAKLFTRAANLLVLDEPTNDLDVETLEALEDRLAEYDGTLLVVSHDRYFLDAIVTSTLVFEDGGQVIRHAGGYSDWLTRHRALAVNDEPTAATGTTSQSQRDTREKQPQRKLSYKLQRELDALPGEIERLERRVAELRAVASDPGFYQRPHRDVQQALEELRSAEQAAETAVDRWGELEDQAAAAASGDAS